MDSALIVPYAETGYPWYSRHAIYGNREIFLILVAEDGRPLEHGPLIEGAVWDSGKRMMDFYRRYREERRGDHDHAPGFVAWAHKGSEGFASWEEALAWLQRRESTR